MHKLKLAGLILRLALAGIFIYASVDKIMHPADFAGIIGAYKVLPDNCINLMAIFLPWLELVLGVLLVFGWWLEGALALVNMLLITFWVSLVFNYFRGLDITCGCFTTKATESSSMVWYMFRDGCFVLLGVGAAVLHMKTKSLDKKTASS